MYINLLIGLVTLVAVWVVLQKLFVREDRPAKMQTLEDLPQKPGDILLEELQKRQSSAATEPVEDPQHIAATYMQPLVAALQEMHTTMPPAMQDALSWSDDGPSVRIRISKPEALRPHILAVTWRAPGTTTNAPRPNIPPSGSYVLRHPDSTEECASSLDPLLRQVARVIVEVLA